MKLDCVKKEVKHFFSLFRGMEGGGHFLTFDLKKPELSIEI